MEDSNSVLKLQNLTEENVDAFLFELYYRSGGGRPINRYDFLLGSRWADWEMGENKWKILTAFLVVIIIIQALFISHYKEEADKNYEG